MTRILHILSGLLFLSAASCGDDAGKASDNAWSCGQQSCPVGTSPHGVEALYAEEVVGLPLVDVTDGPQSHSDIGGIGYAIRADTQCEFACVAIEPCPSGTVPVITADCFTCAQVTETGDIISGGCDFEGEFVDSAGEASPDHEEEVELPEDEEVPGGEEGTAAYCRTSTRWIVEGDFDGNMSVEGSYDDHANEPQSLGEVNQSFLITGRLDRELSHEPGCADVDIFLGDISCQGTATIHISSTGPADITLQIGDQTFTDSAAEVEIVPGALEATIQCVDDWESYDIEVDFGG